MDDENDALWKVLGQAKSAEASPYFVRRVLRDVRAVRQGPSRFQLLLRWLIPVGTTAAVAVSITTWQLRQQDQYEFNAYFDTAADLESLVAFEDTSAWVDVN